jgi:hypothetical protein
VVPHGHILKKIRIYSYDKIYVVVKSSSFPCCINLVSGIKTYLHPLLKSIKRVLNDDFTFYELICFNNGRIAVFGECVKERTLYKLRLRYKRKQFYKSTISYWLSAFLHNVLQYFSSLLV